MKFEFTKLEKEKIEEVRKAVLNIYALIKEVVPVSYYHYEFHPSHGWNSVDVLYIVVPKFNLKIDITDYNK